MKKIYSFVMLLMLAAIATGNAVAQYAEDHCVAHFIVSDEQGEKIEGATVTFEGATYTTDANGVVNVDGQGEEWLGQVLPYSVYKDGYDPFEGTIDFTEGYDGYGLATLKESECTATFIVRDEENEPVADAAVEFEGKSYTTGENGQVVVKGTGWVFKTIDFTVYKDGFDFYEGAITFDGLEGYATVTLELMTCNANIQVLDEAGEPVEGASVNIGLIEGTTDENGRVVLQGKGWFGKTVIASAIKDYAFGETPLTFDESDSAFGQITLVAPECTVSFKVMDAEGEPVAEATVNFQGEDKVTDENGNATFTGKGWEGKKLAWSAYKEFAFAEGEADLTEGIETSVVVTLEAPLCTVAFKVVDEEGEPVADAYVTFQNDTRNTDENGSVSFAGHGWEGQVLPYSISKEYSYVEGTVDFTETVEANVAVVLEAPVCTAEFKVIDEAGEPVAEAVVTFQKEEKTTDANGSVTFTGKGWAGQELGYTAYKDYLFAEGKVDFTETVEASTVVVLQAPVCTASFKVVDEEGEPVAGVGVTIGEQTAETNENGEASLSAKGWEGTEVKFEAYKDGYDFFEGTVDFSETIEASAVVTLVASECTVNFRVMDEAGEPVDGAYVEFNGQEYRTDANGTVTVTGKGWFGKTMTYSAYLGYLHAEGTVEFTETLEAWPVVVLESPVCTANFIVLDADGEPVEGAFIEFQGQEKETDANGRATFTGKGWAGMALNYTVYGGYSQQEGSIDFIESIENTAIVTLTVPAGTATFMIYSDGEEPMPVAGAVITVNGQTAETDANGRAVMTLEGVVGTEVPFTVEAAGYEVYEGTLNFTEGYDAYGIAYLAKTSGIGQIEAETEGDVIYDINGRRVQNPGNGLYIVNGKKVMIRK